MTTTLQKADPPAAVLRAITTAMTAIVASPADLFINLQSAGHSFLITIRTSNPLDQRRLVGKHGQTINALKTIVDAASVDGWQFRILLEEPGDVPRPTVPARNAPDLETVLKAVLGAVPDFRPVRVESIISGTIANFVIFTRQPPDPTLREAVMTIIRATSKVAAINVFVDWDKTHATA